MIYFLLFYNSLNIDFKNSYEFYNNLVNYVSRNGNVLNSLNTERINFLGVYDVIKDIENFNNIEKLITKEDKIFLFTLGGDGTLFNSLSLIKKKFNSDLSIFVFPINFGSKGFYCFYNKKLINDIPNFFLIMYKII